MYLDSLSQYLNEYVHSSKRRLENISKIIHIGSKTVQIDVLVGEIVLRIMMLLYFAFEIGGMHQLRRTIYRCNYPV